MLLQLAACSPEKNPYTYKLKDKELVPEGIAYSEKHNKFYLTSIAKSKIISVDRSTGDQKDFIGSNDFGFMPGVGILVDDKRGHLHALAGYFPLNDSLSSLFTFELESGKLIRKIHVAEDGEHFLNDLIQDRDGNLYITDSKASAVYMLENGGTFLKRLYQSDEIEYPNGIAISEDGSKLYIASFSKGIRILDLEKQELLNPPDTLGLSQGIDGLEFYRGHLYGIQNGVRANGDNFRKLVLNKTEDSILGVEILDSNNPSFDLPLTFAIAGNQAVVIANSNLQFLDQVTLQFTEPDALKPTRLLVYELP